jgi:hypothetical protein
VYREIGSFGFNEPSFTCWPDEPGTTDTAGTRLSPGSRVFCVPYIEGIVTLVEELKDVEEVATYKNYGSPYLEHLRTMQVLAEAKGRDLEIKDVQTTLGVAVALVERLRAVSNDTHLESFAVHLLSKIEIRRNKIALLEKMEFGTKITGEKPVEEVVIHAGDGTLTPALFFERLGVFESTLWEYAMLVASYLSWADVMQTLRDVIPNWVPVMNPDDPTNGRFAGDIVEIGLTRPQRVFFPSGYRAAEVLYEFLLKNKFKPLKVPIGREKLNEYKPYFEFYQNTGFMLHTENENTVGAQSQEQLQIWLNLSDSLHWRMSGKPLGECAIMIAEDILKILQEPLEVKRPTALVLDYTKICSNIPSSALYVLMSEIALQLLKSELIPHIWFLRSNLKYNTGCLDRYQCGEVLLFNGGGPIDPAALVADAAESFEASEDKDPLKAKWSLKGYYLPLMHRTRLLADAITAAKWEAYKVGTGQG